ncbi:septum formation inhibitor Maf [Microvirga tunisiensis]|uniref:Nucleoside triphosphate pyrophosphatase n=2 Tax=Pannonibacter tanglangensis TaxID=2750084 RepID=A0A7X5JA54_9HYPH|nr:MULTISPECIES: Maf family protein [unclassified Pannonibacter]NBN65596.1 septum formation inhibitor Maf [Pannonibacter sp. XCT-34]NBN80177.1 septum formation inhibitor Maf [Pannonibacter sp. XCT-53]
MGLVLASGSRIRATLLSNARLDFTVDPATVDERAVELPLLDAGVAPEEIARVLAEAKALDVAARRPQDLVIGADQVLGLGNTRFTKPADRDAARRQLQTLAGQTHDLHSAVVLARGGTPLWQTVSTARLTMRSLSPDEIDAYLDLAGEAILSSVGCYQLENVGIRLFDRIEGDYFTILGLPLLPLLGELRRLGEIAP